MLIHLVSKSGNCGCRPVNPSPSKVRRDSEEVQVLGHPSTAFRLLRSAQSWPAFSYEFGSTKRWASGSISDSIVGLALFGTDS